MTPPSSALSEIGAMTMLHRIVANIQAKRREHGTFRALSRLGDRELADFGLAREDVRTAARLASRESTRDVPVELLVRRLAEQAAEGQSAPAARRTAGVRGLVDRALDAKIPVAWSEGLVP
jgi:uncharacterized protein YjiS (DUF1127 family)